MLKCASKILLLMVFLSCSSAQRETASGGLNISLEHNNLREKKARELLRDFNEEYTLEPYLFTRTIHIKSGTIPRSHPVLTLNTRLINRPDFFLSTLLHEQMHWYLSQEEKENGVDTFMTLVKKHYPDIPVGRREGGARNTHSSYLHLAVNFLELKSLSNLIGKTAAEKVFLEKRIYRGINLIVLSDYNELHELVSQAGIDLGP